MSHVLVDSSAWIAFFRGEPEVIRRLDPHLANGSLSTCGPIVAELLSGARTRQEFDLLESLLEGIPLLPEPNDVWLRVAGTRFDLARNGYRASLVDLYITLTALDSRHTLWTRDRDFSKICKVVAIELEVF